MLSVHLMCLQHICCDAERHMGFSATADQCYKIVYLQAV